MPHLYLKFDSGLKHIKNITYYRQTGQIKSNKGFLAYIRQPWRQVKIGIRAERIFYKGNIFKLVMIFQIFRKTPKILMPQTN